MATSEEIAQGKSLAAAAPINRVLKAEDTSIVLAKGGPVEREKAGAPAFKPGDVVCARNDHPTGHTRLPRYLRSRQGVIHKARCAHVNIQ